MMNNSHSFWNLHSVTNELEGSAFCNIFIYSTLHIWQVKPDMHNLNKYEFVGAIGTVRQTLFRFCLARAELLLPRIRQ